MGNNVSRLLENSPGPGAKENSAQRRPARRRASGTPRRGLVPKCWLHWGRDVGV